jgi:hypothetical protein
MKTFLIAIVFLIIGAAVGGFLAIGIGAGAGAGAGILVGSQAGACLAVESAKEKGLLTPEQVDEVLGSAIGKIKGKSEPPPDAKLQWVASDADCVKMISEMEKTAQSR